MMLAAPSRLPPSSSALLLRGHPDLVVPAQAAQLIRARAKALSDGVAAVECEKGVILVVGVPDENVRVGLQWCEPEGRVPRQRAPGRLTPVEFELAFTAQTAAIAA